MIAQFQRSVLFPRQFTQPDARVAATVDGLEEWWIESDQGPVESWFLPATTGEAPHPTIVFAHGNAELIELWPHAMAEFRDAGFNVLLPEYRGYGRSAGSPTQARITEDFVAFYDRLASDPRVDRERIVYHGRSLGGGALGQLAALRPPCAFILQSTFTSIADLAGQWMVPRVFVADPFDTLSVLQNLAIPVLVMHGRRDTVVPYEHALHLHRELEGSELITYDCDHNDFPPNARQYWDDLLRWLDHNVGRR
jgi:fermentation-respiration switch protein FrsA (DUF1100 family)